MTNRKAIQVLRRHAAQRVFGGRAHTGNEITEALALAVKALIHYGKFTAGAAGGNARARKYTHKEMSAMGKKGGRPASLRARAKALRIKIPRGISRQRLHQIVSAAEKKP